MSVSIGAGTEMERYLRALELVGKLPSGQWEVRPFGPRELSAMRLPERHPWARQFSDTSPAPRSTWSVVSPSASLIANSGFAYGFNDGPVWAGKGITAVLTGGITARRSGFSVVLDPVAFVAQNVAFGLAATGLSGVGVYGDRFTPGAIDQPQRFGASVYRRLAPGESHFRWDGHGLAVGVATESEVWGPAYEHPIILGNNAGGFPRAFAGTSAPIDLGFMTVHGRILWGRLDESAFGPDIGNERRHFATGATATIGVKGFPGLELGGARFFHTTWPQNGLNHAPWFRVFQEFIRSDLAQNSGNSFGTNPDNQLASVFMRWAPPGAGIEVYGEYGREDRNSEWRDFFQEPDHDGAYLLGIARAWTNTADDRVTVVRAEILNSRISHLQQSRGQVPWYVHGVPSNGHTEGGQVLASVGGHGGGAFSAAVDRYSASGRTTIRLDRVVWATPLTAQGLPIAQHVDVTQAIGVERARYVRRGEVTVAATFVKEFNRYFSSDAVNANVAVSFRVLR